MTKRILSVLTAALLATALSAPAFAASKKGTAPATPKVTKHAIKKKEATEHWNKKKEAAKHGAKHTTKRHEAKKHAAKKHEAKKSSKKVEKK